MIIIPAIDIKGGKVVRLLQGRFDQTTVYSNDAPAVARKWVQQGATWLHVVDLDGAQTGEVKNFAIIATICQSAGVPIEVGGGIRSAEDVERYLNVGVKRVILSTKAVEDKKALAALLKRWPYEIAVSVDCVNGFVAQKGWTEVTKIKGVDFAKQLERLGLHCIIYTDIKKDGMLSGPNLEGLSLMLKSVKMSVIASGGVSTIYDIKNLLDLKAKNLLAVISGKALYEGQLELPEAIQLCSQNV